MNSDRKDVNKFAGMAFDEALTRLSNTDPKELSAVAQSSMKDNAIDTLIAKFEDAAQVDDEGVEFWTARDIARLLDYSEYRNFLKIVEKAEVACTNSGQPVEHHFVDFTEMVDIGSGASREIDNIRLTRYACYLIAQNGDSRKKPISFAQTYFAIQTRRQEIRDDDQEQYIPLSEDQKRLLLRDEIKEHNAKLASAAKGAGVIEPLDFAIFQNFGYQGLYGGLDRRGIQRRKGLRSKENILDHMGSTELAANLFRATQTEEKLRRDKIKGKEAANSTHFEVGRKVRQAIKDIGGTMPEALPPAEDIVKVGRRLKKAIASGSKRLK
jgi:DNA-damage-inducible protein D